MTLLDHKPVPIEHIKGNWALWDVTVEINGQIKEGSMQGDGDDLWALDTFESN